MQPARIKTSTKFEARDIEAFCQGKGIDCEIINNLVLVEEPTREVISYATGRVNREQLELTGE